MLKRILSAVLTVAMLLTVFSVGAVAATSVFVKKPVSLVTEDFDKEDGTHAFSVYSGTVEMVEGETEADGKAMHISKYFKAVNVDLPEKYIAEFDFVHTIEDADSESKLQVMFVDTTSSVTVNNFGLYIGVLPFTPYEWYSMKIEVDTSKLTATGNTPAGAVNVFWKKKGAENWIAAKQDTDNTFDSSEILYYRSHSAFGTTIFGDNAVGFGANIILDNFDLYYEVDVLDRVYEGYALEENFDASTHVFSAGTVENGVISHKATITASVDVPDYAVIEFDAYRTNTLEFDVYVKYNETDPTPHFGMRIMGDSYYADKWYSYKIIVQKDKLINNSNNRNSAAIKAYRKAADETEWKLAPMSTGYNSVTAIKSGTTETVGTVGEPMVRFHTGIGSANLAENSIGFSEETVLDNIKVSDGGVVSVSDFVNNEEKIGATVEFTDTDAVELSGVRSIFFVLTKEDRLVKVDFAQPSVQNDKWTAKLENEKTDFDNIRIFVWDDNNVPAAKAWNVTSLFDIK